MHWTTKDTAKDFGLLAQAELSGSNEDPIAMVGICSGDLVHLMEPQCPGAEPSPGLTRDSKLSRHTSALQDSSAGLSSDLLDRPASLRVAATAPFQQDSLAPTAQNGAGPSSQQNGAGPSAQENGASPSSQQLEAAAAVPVGEPMVACEPDELMMTAPELDNEVRKWLHVAFQSATDVCKCTPPCGASTMFNLKLLYHVVGTAARNS